MPCRWSEGGLSGFAGRVRFRRRFGYPGRIDDAERVWMTFAGVTGHAGIHLNGRLLGSPDDPAQGFEYEVTPLLQARNELIVEIEAGTDGGLWGEVALEIRRTAYLRQVRIQVKEHRLQVEGEIVGSAERPLDLYVILDRSTVASTVADAGRSFSLVSEPISVQGSHTVRVELVDGATVWYTLEQTINLG
jgi:hypothetical protein